MLLGLGGGPGLGGLLAWVGLHLTKFEIGGTKPHYYTPNTTIRIGLTLLVAGRVLHRIGVLYFSDRATAGSTPAFMQGQLTMLVIGLTAGYYIAGNSGVLLKSSRG